WLGELRELEAVIEIVFVADARAEMAQAVKLRADLPDLADEHLIKGDGLILAGRSVCRRTGNGQTEMALAGKRHAVLIEVAELIDLARLNQPGCFEHFLRRHAI